MQSLFAGIEISEHFFDISILGEVGEKVRNSSSPLRTKIYDFMDIVVFEYLFAGSVMDGDLESETPIATHEDLNDEDQTVYVPEMPREPVNTGVNSHLGLYLTAMLTSGAGLVWLYNRRRRR